MQRKTVRFSTVAVFLGIILVTMLLSRMEERRQAIATQAEEKETAVPVLMYHHLLKQEENTRYVGNSIVTYTYDFEQQLKWMQEQGFESISPQQLADWFFDGAPLPDKPVMITFDDGYLSNYTYGYPLLKKYGYSAVLFSVTGKISESPVSFDPARINMLDQTSMQAGADVFYYASHTDSLHTLRDSRSALTAADPETVQQDLKKSLERLAPFPSCTPFLFSYPYGQCNQTVQTVLRENGIRLAFCAHDGRLTRQSDPLALPRFGVSYAVSLKAFQEHMNQYL